MKKLNFHKILHLLENKKFISLSKILNRSHPADIAEIINELPEELQIRVFKLLGLENSAGVLSEVREEVLKNILKNTNKKRLFSILNELESDEATDIASELEEDLLKEILENIDEKDSQEIKQLLVYDEDSAGGIMQKEIISVEKEMLRDEMITHIRENYQDVGNLYYVFVVDSENKLIGILEVSKLLLCKAEKRASDLMEKDVIFAYVDQDQEEVANIFRKYDIYILPVVDRKEHLLGRITVDDIIDVIDEEASEDAYKMVGLDNEDKVFTSPFSSVRRRLPWLVLNLFTALLVSSVVGIFEETIAELSFLAVLMPIVAGLGGNSGTQTLTVITRGIALGELTIHNTSRAILKEITVGVINGLMIGLAAMIIAYYLKGNLWLGAVLGISMICNMFIAGLVGSLIPVLMKTLKIDPALASSVIITMLTDIGGFASFLGLATIILL